MDPRGCLKLLSGLEPAQSFGKVTKVVGLIAEGRGLKAPLGSICRLLPEDKHSEGIAAEVVGFRDGALLFMPYSDPRGIRPGSLIQNSSTPPLMPVGSHFLGRAVNAFGEPMDHGGQIVPSDFYPLYCDPPNPLERPRITERLDVGVRAVNALLTLGKGQRVGIMAGSGVGKSTVMGMMAKTTKADVNVICLVGERGREVVEFMERDLGPEGMARSVLVVATSDQSPLVRMRCAYAATAMAEYFRDQGKDVLLMMDSVTRFCMAGREVGLAAGEPPTRGGYTPSVFSALPKLLERAGRSMKGSITGIYTVLVDGDDLTEPIADATRAILDGHIVLTRELADQGHYPAIDVLRSVSRLRTDITTRQEQAAGRVVVKSLATYRRVEDMINIGAYAKGSNPEIDQAMTMVGPIHAFLRQLVEETSPLDESMEKLIALAALADPSFAKKQTPQGQAKGQKGGQASNAAPVAAQQKPPAFRKL